MQLCIISRKENSKRLKKDKLIQQFEAVSDYTNCLTYETKVPQAMKSFSQQQEKNSFARLETHCGC